MLVHVVSLVDLDVGEIRIREKPLKLDTGSASRCSRSTGPCRHCGLVHVALPHQRVQAQVPVDRSKPPPHLIPRDSDRWRKLYRGRAAVEREFGRLKHEWSLLPIRVRGIERVRLHADLTILARLACALAKARAVPLAA